MCVHIIDSCILILYSVTLLNPYFLDAFYRFHRIFYMNNQISANKDSFAASFPIRIHFIRFLSFPFPFYPMPSSSLQSCPTQSFFSSSSLSALNKASSTKLNRSSKSSHLDLVPNLSRKASSLRP